jgi:hypothetical protein
MPRNKLTKKQSGGRVKLLQLPLQHSHAMPAPFGIQPDELPTHGSPHLPTPFHHRDESWKLESLVNHHINDNLKILLYLVDADKLKQVQNIIIGKRHRHLSGHLSGHPSGHQSHYSKKHKSHHPHRSRKTRVHLSFPMNFKQPGQLAKPPARYPPQPVDQPMAMHPGMGMPPAQTPIPMPMVIPRIHKMGIKQTNVVESNNLDEVIMD